MNRIAWSVVLAIVFFTGCSDKVPVVIVASRLTYDAGGSIGFGSGDRFGLQLELHTSRPSKGVTVTFLADGIRVETKSIEVMNGAATVFSVETRDRRFTHGSARYVEVMIRTPDETSSGPHTLSVPTPQTNF